MIKARRRRRKSAQNNERKKMKAVCLQADGARGSVGGKGLETLFKSRVFHHRHDNR